MILRCLKLHVPRFTTGRTNLFNVSSECLWSHPHSNQTWKGEPFVSQYIMARPIKNKLDIIWMMDGTCAMALRNGVGQFGDIQILSYPLKLKYYFPTFFVGVFVGVVTVSMCAVFCFFKANVFGEKSVSMGHEALPGGHMVPFSAPCGHACSASLFLS